MLSSNPLKKMQNDSPKRSTVIVRKIFAYSTKSKKLYFTVTFCDNFFRLFLQIFNGLENSIKFCVFRYSPHIAFLKKKYF
jgi:hypothetical protein